MFIYGQFICKYGGRSITVAIPVSSLPSTDRHEELEDEVPAGTKVRAQTQKGKEYTISQLMSALQSAKQSWEQQLTHLQLQRINKLEIPALQ